MRGKYLFWLFMVLILVSTVSAFSSIEITPIEDRIEFGEKGIYDVTIINEESYQQTYNIVAPLSGLDWNVNVVPISDSTINIAGNSNKTVRFEVIPLDRYKPGIYLISLRITTDRGGVKSAMLKVYMGSTEPRTYLPSLKTRVDMNDKIDPRETQSIKLTIENENMLEFSDLTIEMNTDLIGFDKSQQIDLKPFESKTIEFTVEPSRYQQPKRYYIFFVMTRGDETVKVVEKYVDVISLTPEFEPEIEETKEFLVRRQKYEFTNDGNILNTQPVKIEMGFFKDLITSTDQDMYALSENGKRYLAKDVKLGPGEKIIINLKTNYRVPIIFLILVVAAVLIYIFYRNPVSVTKSASNVVFHEGGMAALKVTLVVRNTSNKIVKDVVVHDNIPSIASVEKDVEMGTLKPSQILRNKQGGILAKWKISELDAKEERLVSYKIKSRLGIVGTITLSRAKVIFKDAKGRERTSYSNTYSVGGEKE